MGLGWAKSYTGFYFILQGQKPVRGDRLHSSWGPVQSENVGGPKECPGFPDCNRRVLNQFQGPESEHDRPGRIPGSQLWVHESTPNRRSFPVLARRERVCVFSLYYSYFSFSSNTGFKNIYFNLLWDTDFFLMLHVINTQIITLTETSFRDNFSRNRSSPDGEAHCHSPRKLSKLPYGPAHSSLPGSGAAWTRLFCVATPKV